MSTTTTLKLQLNDEIRRISLNAPLSLRAIQARAADLFNLGNDVATIRFTYVDADGDAITVGSDGDLAESIAHFQGKPIKFNVVKGGVSAVSAAAPAAESAPKPIVSESKTTPSTASATPKNLSEFVDSFTNDAELQTLARNFGVSLEGSLADIVAQAASNPLIAQLIQDFRRTDNNDDDDDSDADSESDGEEAVEPAKSKAVPVNADAAAGESKPIHNAFCDGCHVRIQGVRFKCAVCPDFDFCEKCQVFAGEKHPTTHSFYKIERPAPAFFGHRQGPYFMRAPGAWHGPTGQHGPCGPRNGPHHGRCQRWQQAAQAAQAAAQAAPAPAAASPAPAAAAAPVASVQYELEHVTVAAGSPLPAGQDVVKLFKVKNVSGAEWPESTALVFASGVRVGDFRIPVGKVPAGEERYIAVDVKAPESAGRAVSAYRLQHASGAIQGEPLVIDFVVVSN